MKFCLLMFSLLLTGCHSLSMRLPPEESAKIIALSKRAIAVSGVLNAAELKNWIQPSRLSPIILRRSPKQITASTGA
jgi:hypothetical protein